MSACGSVNWAKQLFEVAMSRAFDATSNVVPSCDGLLSLYYIYREYSPVMDDRVRGVFLASGGFLPADI